MLADLHWQDDRLIHTWSPGGSDRGWDAYGQRLEREFNRYQELSFHFSDIGVEIFQGRFAVVRVNWSCGFASSGGSKGKRDGVATFVLSKMGNSWKIVADHFFVHRQGELTEGLGAEAGTRTPKP